MTTALKSQKERNTSSGQQANHPLTPPHPVFSFLPPAHTSFSKTIPWDSLPSGFYFFPPDSCRARGREAAWAPGETGLHSKSPGQPCLSKPLRPVLQVLCSKLPVSSPDPCWVHQDTLAGILWHLCSCLSFPVFFPPPRARSTLLLTHQVQPLVLCFFHSIQLRVPGWLVTHLLCARLVCVPLSLMTYGDTCSDARLSAHMSPICKFFAPFSDAATQGPLLPPVHCQHPHSSSVISLPLCSLALLI